MILHQDMSEGEVNAFLSLCAEHDIRCVQIDLPVFRRLLLLKSRTTDWRKVDKMYIGRVRFEHKDRVGVSSSDKTVRSSNF